MSGARVTVSVPAKLILIGEHAVVYGHPGVITALDLRLSVTLAPSAEAGCVRLVRPRDGVVRLAWRRIVDDTDAARADWERTGGTAVAPPADDPLRLLRLALGEASRVFGGETPAVDLELRSEIPAGAGFGSSAALGTAVAAALGCFISGRLDRAAISRCAAEVERRQHGTPSGADHTTVIRGGTLWFVRGPERALHVEAVRATPEMLRRFLVFDTGRPAETTGEVVAAVRRRLESDVPESVLDEMGNLARRFRAALEGDGPGDEVAEAMRAYQRRLERLGAVPGALRETVRRIEARGGAAKISGAGGLTGECAGALLVYHDDAGAAAAWPELRRFRRLECVLGVEGVRREEAS